PGWAGLANTLGFTAVPLADLLVEIAATGSATLYIDGMDRIEKQHRPIIRDVVSAMITWLFTGRFDRFFYYRFRSANLENSAHLRSKYASEVERFHRLTPERRSTSALCGAFTTRESARRLTHVYMVQAQSLHILGRTSGERESTLAARKASS